MPQLPLRKKIVKKKYKKVRAPIKLDCHWRQQLNISLQSILYSNNLTSFLTETEPHTTITNQPEKLWREYSDRKYNESNQEFAACEDVWLCDCRDNKSTIYVCIVMSSLKVITINTLDFFPWPNLSKQHPFVFGQVGVQKQIGLYIISYIISSNIASIPQLIIQGLGQNLHGTVMTGRK